MTERFSYLAQTVMILYDGLPADCQWDFVTILRPSPQTLSHYTHDLCPEYLRAFWLNALRGARGLRWDILKLDSYTFASQSISSAGSTIRRNYNGGFWRWIPDQVGNDKNDLSEPQGDPSSADSGRD